MPTSIFWGWRQLPRSFEGDVRPAESVFSQARNDEEQNTAGELVGIAYRHYRLKILPHFAAAPHAQRPVAELLRGKYRLMVLPDVSAAPNAPDAVPVELGTKIRPEILSRGSARPHAADARFRLYGADRLKILLGLAAGPDAQDVPRGEKGMDRLKILPGISTAPHTDHAFCLFQDKRGPKILPDIAASPYAGIGKNRQSPKNERQQENLFQKHFQTHLTHKNKRGSCMYLAGALPPNSGLTAIFFS